LSIVQSVSLAQAWVRDTALSCGLLFFGFMPNALFVKKLDGLRSSSLGAKAEKS
jgi:hypothetical protein